MKIANSEHKILAPFRKLGFEGQVVLPKWGGSFLLRLENESIMCGEL